MLVTPGLTIVSTYENQTIRHLVNLGRKKRTDTIFTGANGMNTGLQLTTQKIDECNTTPQHIILTAQNCQTKNN